MPTDNRASVRLPDKLVELARKANEEGLTTVTVPHEVLSEIDALIDWNPHRVLEERRRQATLNAQGRDIVLR